MTDRLSSLLHDEASALSVPPVPTGIVAAGHREVRRRRTRTALAGAVAALLVAVGASAAIDRWRDGTDSIEPAGQLAYQQWGAWANGDEVHVGRGVAVVPDVTKLQYTSVGAIVTTQDNRIVLVDPEGNARDLDLDLRGDLFAYGPVATDATQPYVAYVRALDARLNQAVVLDLTTGEETAVGAAFPDRKGVGSYAESLSGDELLYSRLGGYGLVNWRTGDRLPAPPGPWITPRSVGHGATIGYDNGTHAMVVTSLSDGSTLLEVPVTEPAATAASLSVDGRYLATSSVDGLDVYDVASGKSVHLGDDRTVADYGWTPDGHLVGGRAAEQEVEVCDPEDGTCTGIGHTYGDELTLVQGATPIIA
jgi:hypothetical protein